MDPEVWNLLHDGAVIAVARDGAVVRVTVSAPHLARPFGADAFDLVLSDVRAFAYRPYSKRWDEPWVEEPAAIVRAAPELVEAKLEAEELRVWGARGFLAADYGALTLEAGGRTVPVEALRAEVAAYWSAWRAQNDLRHAHALVHEALRGGWSASLLPRLLDAWRSERSSELADVIEVLGHALDRTPERAARPLAAPEDVVGWPTHYRNAPSAALDALVDAAVATFDLLAREQPPEGSADVGGWLDAKDALGERWWRAFADATATLPLEPADPRIGRAMIRMLRSPSNHWFRIDQVGHVAGPFSAPDARPSFADHALAAIETHGDAGTPALLQARADIVAIEADCNGGEMVRRLRALAATLRERYPTDRTLPDTAKTALMHRPLD